MYLKDYTKAIKNFGISLQIAKKNNYAAQEANTYIGLTKLYMARGDMRAAKRYGLRAYRLTESLKQIENHKESAALVAKSSAVLGEYKDAYAYEVIFRQLSDSILNEDQIKAITRVEEKYMFEKEMEKRSLLAKEESLQKQALLDKQIFIRNLSLFLLVISIVVIFYVVKIKNQKQEAITLYEKQRKEIEAVNLELKRSSKDLQKANKTRDKFFQIIGHDLRSPMIQLVQFAELITSNFKIFPEEKIVSLLGSIGKSTQEALNMLDNLFQWAETQKQKISFTPQSISIKSLIENNANLAELRAKEKEIRLTATNLYDKDVIADKNIIDTLLRNLISNALKFTPRGGTIDIKNQVIDQQLITSITDSGIGIPKELLPNLFELDNRKTTYGTDNEKGTGVGLNLCNELIKRHKGKIWVESEINKGSTFNFSIPLDLNVKAT
jgi:signal transduction histidine kinase